MYLKDDISTLDLKENNYTVYMPQSINSLSVNPEDEFDLLTQYNILTKRIQCTRFDPDYAKNKVSSIVDRMYSKYQQLDPY